MNACVPDCICSCQQTGCGCRKSKPPAEPKPAALTGPTTTCRACNRRAHMQTVRTPRRVRDVVPLLRREDPMTTLAATPITHDQVNLLDLIADRQTPLGKPFADAFRDACEADAEAHDGWVHPSRVNALLHDALGDINPRSFSAQWAPACGPNGFLDKTDVVEPIDPTYSDGNGNKAVRLRRWRGWPVAAVAS